MADATMTLTFGGRAAIVTGSASGIGAQVAKLLVGAGIRTHCLDRAETPLFEGADKGLQQVHTVDIADLDGLTRALAGDLHDVAYVVNCAGIHSDTGYAGVGLAEWDRLLKVNLVGAYNVVELARPHLVTQPVAAVVNVASLEAHRVIALSNPDPTPHYAASKAALAMLTRTAARALAPSGVRVNSVSPGFVATPMASQHGDTTALPPALQDRVPLARFAQPDEIAHVVAFLLSDQAGYITGSDLVVDGGFSLT
ncbi:SDR family NAD(P)-dependent oxidoreductase [Pseudonocardia hispaniensis]|uniref:SDR family NAD(P)-dependent oxidoreductase n=1 Tax=Pseudonocardia hispaniensis TaxID=904933 RepID=A0ABW1IZ25_9PSEU